VFHLGIGGSGKSTVAKQLKIIYNNGFSSQELSDYKAVLQLNSLKSMKTLVQQCKKLNLKIPKDLKVSVGKSVLTHQMCHSKKLTAYSWTRC
jgi:hypothetical protein